jgi:hypothetical protein
MNKYINKRMNERMNDLNNEGMTGWINKRGNAITLTFDSLT